MADRVVAVTGAAGALGRVVADRLAADGAKVVAIGHGEEARLPETAALRLGGVDLTDEDSTRRAFEAIQARFARLDGLANIAGGFAWEKVTDGSVATWERLFALNLKTALNACRAAIPLLGDGGGAIVNIGAAGAARAEPGMAAYAASKSGVARLTEGLAAEIKDKGVRVNAVLPSIIDTAANRAEMPKADFTKWVTTAELAEVIVFLLSGRASGITGALIPVTGRV